MKKLVLSFLFLAAASIAFSQTSGGPDAYGYVWRDNNDALGPVYNWVDITTAPGAVHVTGLTDDNSVGFFPIGFQFRYYWYPVSQFKIGANGYIIFNIGSPSIAAPFPTVPSIAQPQDFIGAFMSDLNFGGVGNAGECWYWSNLTDTLIVSYINVPFFLTGTPGYSGANTFQVILSKVDSSITLQYELQTGVSNQATGTKLSIGIENLTGKIGLQHLPLNAYPVPQTAIKYYHPSNSTYVVNDAGTTYCNNPETGGLFIPKDGSPFSLNAQIENSGNQSASSFNVNMRVINSTNAVQVQQTIAASGLVPGQTENLTSDSTFKPTVAGTYRFQTITQLTGDSTPSNNSKSLELRVVDTTQNFMTLAYTGNTPVPAANSVSWQGGNAGIGVEIIPPFYPCYIRSVEYYIRVNPTAANFYSLIYDNTSSPGLGNLLDSTYVSAADVHPGSWNSVSITSPIEIDNGSVFIAWMMDGSGIALGMDTTSPKSNRSYEILGGWSGFRYREIQDPMIRMVISSSPTAAIQNPLSSESIGEFYPSPTSGKVMLEYEPASGSKESIFSFYDLQGKLVETRRILHSTTLSRQPVSFDLSNLDAGLYICKITNRDREYNKKLVIGK